MKLTVNFGSIDIKTINLPKQIPIFSDYNFSELIGEATILKDGTAEVYLINEESINLQLQSIYELGIRGTAKREGNFITEFNLQGCSLQFKKSQELGPKAFI